MQAKTEELKGPKKLSEFKVNPSIAATLGQLQAAPAAAKAAANGTIPAVHAAPAAPADLLLALDAPASADPAPSGTQQLRRCTQSGVRDAQMLQAEAAGSHRRTACTLKVQTLARCTQEVSRIAQTGMLRSLQALRMTGMRLPGARAPSLQQMMTGCQALPPAAMEPVALQHPVTPLASLQALLHRPLCQATPPYASHYPGPSCRGLQPLQSTLAMPALGSLPRALSEFGVTISMVLKNATRMKSFHVAPGADGDFSAATRMTSFHLAPGADGDFSAAGFRSVCAAECARPKHACGSSAQCRPICRRLSCACCCTVCCFRTKANSKQIVPSTL